MATLDRPRHVQPSLLLLGFFFLGLLAARLRPWDLIGARRLAPYGFVVVAAAIALMYWATRTMDRSGTTKVVGRESTSLVTAGPFRLCRHPAYVAFVLWYVGAVLVVDTWWPLVLLPLAVVGLHHFVVVPEEAELVTAFGEEYRAYQRSVRSCV